MILFVLLVFPFRPLSRLEHLLLHDSVADRTVVAKILSRDIVVDTNCLFRLPTGISLCPTWVRFMVSLDVHEELLQSYFLQIGVRPAQYRLRQATSDVLVEFGIKRDALAFLLSRVLLQGDIPPKYLCQWARCCGSILVSCGFDSDVSI